MLKRKGTTLFRCGEAGKGAFLIHSGQVRLALADAPFVYPSRVLGPGNIIGLPASFSGEPYSLTATAAKDCHVDFIPRARLLSLFRHNPQVGKQIVRILSEEISDMRHDEVGVGAAITGLDGTVAEKMFFMPFAVNGSRV